MRLIAPTLLIIPSMSNGQLQGMEQIKKLFNALGFKKRYAAGQAPLERVPLGPWQLIVAPQSHYYKEMRVSLQMMNNLVRVSKALKNIMLSEPIQKIKTDMLKLISLNNEWNRDGISVLLQAINNKNAQRISDLLINGARPGKMKDIGTNMLYDPFFQTLFVIDIESKFPDSNGIGGKKLIAQFINAYPDDKLNDLYNALCKHLRVDAYVDAYLVQRVREMVDSKRPRSKLSRQVDKSKPLFVSMAVYVAILFAAKYMIQHNN